MQEDNDNKQSVGTLSPGSDVGHYQVIDMIGKGGMGEIYLADDRQLQRQVVLKFLPAHLAVDNDCRTRFRQEAQAAAKLNHPNIVTIYEVGEYGSRPFIAMEYIHGRTLRDILLEGPMAPVRAAEIICQTCQGLQAAHEAGTVHRDIKPANIMLDDKGRVRLLDFGLAKALCSELPSQSQATAGTVNYLAPEVLTGGAITPASDLFSLGVVLYQMLAGQLPFTGDYEAAVLYAIVNEVPRDVRDINPRIPERLAAIVDRLLQKDPLKRFQSAQEVREALSCRSEETQKEIPVQVKRSVRNRLVYYTTVTVLIVVTSISVWNYANKPPAGATSKKVLAVLPFDNLGSADDDYFANGMTDAVAANLANSGEIAVIQRAGTMSYRKSVKTSQQIGTELGAKYLLTGTIQWDKAVVPGQIRITAGLINVERGNYLWRQQYDRSIDRVFLVQSDIANQVTRSLKIEVRSEASSSVAAQPTENLEAYDYYLRGNDYFNRSWELNDIRSAIQMYQRAVELDSTFALAYAMLSRGHSSMYWEYFDHSDQRRATAEEAVARALTLQPQLAEAHLAKGYVSYHCYLDYSAALREFDLALKGQPNNADLYNAIAAVQRRQGLLQQASQNFAKALELDPRSPLRAFDVGLTFGMMRQFTSADEYLDRAISLAPDWPLAYIYKAWLAIFENGDTAQADQVLASASGKADLSRSKYYWWLLRIIEPNTERQLTEVNLGSDTAAYYLQVAEINRLLGQRQAEAVFADSARRLLEPQLKYFPEDARVHSYLGLAYAGLRQKGKALMHGGKAVELIPTTREAFDAPFWIMNLAESEVIFGENDSAVKHLGILLSIPGFATSTYLKLDPIWKPLRGNPGFQQLIQPIS